MIRLCHILLLSLCILLLTSLSECRQYKRTFVRSVVHNRVDHHHARSAATAALFRALGSSAIIQHTKKHSKPVHRLKQKLQHHHKAKKSTTKFPITIPGNQIASYEHETVPSSFPTKESFPKWNLEKWKGPHGTGDYPYKTEHEGGVGAWAGAYAMGREKAEAIHGVNPGELAQLWSDLDKQQRLQHGVDEITTGGAFEKDGYGGAYGEKYGDMITTNSIAGGGYGPLNGGDMPHIRHIRSAQQPKTHADVQQWSSGFTPNDIATWMTKGPLENDPGRLVLSETKQTISIPKSKFARKRVNRYRKLL